MQTPEFDFKQVKYLAGKPIFERGETLFKQGKVGPIEADERGYSAIIQGTKPYQVHVSIKNLEYVHCQCYMGEKGQYCKHVIALALNILDKTGLLDNTKPIAETDLALVKPHVTEAIKNIKPYNGPSRIWFQYQGKLEMGCEMILDAISALPAEKDNVKFLWSLVKRLDKKIANGVDDSNGIVGDCAHTILQQLTKYTKDNPALNTLITKYTTEKTNFCFEDNLKKMLE